MTPGRPDWRGGAADLFGCFFIPLYTLLFTHDTRWFTTNFSVIASLRDHRHGFFLWGMLVGGYLLCTLLPAIRRLARRPLPPAAALILGFLLLLAGVILPYTPDTLPKLARLHMICALLACVLLTVCMLLLLWPLARRDWGRWGEYLKWLLATIAGSAALFLLPGFITSALEIFFTLSCTLLARRLWYLSRKV